jgi:hypothetical protein
MQQLAIRANWANVRRTSWGATSAVSLQNGVCTGISHLVSTDTSAFIDRPENAPALIPAATQPPVDRGIDPRWHRGRPHPSILPDQVHDAPTAIPLLNVLEGEAAASERRRHPRSTARMGAIPQSLVGGGVRHVEEPGARLAVSQFPRRTPFGGDSLYPRDPIGQFGYQQPIVSGLDSELSSATRQVATVAFVKPAAAPRRNSL